MLWAAVALWGALAPALAGASDVSVAPQLLTSAGAPTERTVTSGALDQYFGPFNYREARARGGVFWRQLPRPSD